jgi:hypothetical protein
VTSSAIPVPWGHLAGGTLHISGSWTDAQIGLEVKVFNQWQPVLDQNCQYTGMCIPTATGNASFNMPVNWFFVCGGDSEVVLWSNNGTASGVPQAAARTIVLDLKS